MKIDFNLLVILLAEIFALIVILWLAFHSSEYVTHVEFITGTLVLFGTMITGYWSIWSRISQISEDVGELKANVKYLKSKTNKIESRIDKMGVKIEKMMEDITQIKSDVKFLKRKIK